MSKVKSVDYGRKIGHRIDRFNIVDGKILSVKYNRSRKLIPMPMIEPCRCKYDKVLHLPFVLTTCEHSENLLCEVFYEHTTTRRTVRSVRFSSGVYMKEEFFQKNNIKPKLIYKR